MIGTLVGKQHINGISKSTNKNYSGYKLFVEFVDDNVEGLATADLYISDDKFDCSDLVVGSDYNFCYDMTFNGYSKLIDIVEA